MNFISTAIGMVRAGLGVTVVSSMALERAVMTGVRARAIKHPDFAREISVIRKKGRTISPAAERFAKTVVAVRDSLGIDNGAAAHSGRRAKSR